MDWNPPVTVKNVTFWPRWTQFICFLLRLPLADNLTPTKTITLVLNIYIHCLGMVIIFFVALNWLNLKICRTSHKHRQGVTLCSSATAKFALQYWLFKPQQIVCPFPEKFCFLLLPLDFKAFPSSLPFLFEPEELRLKNENLRMKKASNIHWRSLKHVNNKMASTFTFDWRARWEHSDPDSSWAWPYHI